MRLEPYYDSQAKVMVKKDLLYLSILIFITLAVGIYLVSTAVMISKDGVRYITWAQSLGQEVLTDPFGYPLAIYLAEKLFAIFFEINSNQNWILVAQTTTLFCRLVSIISLYFVGKLIVGQKASFLSILVLTCLPYPAENGSDALTDWPHIMVLSIGILVLCLSARKGTWWLFGVTGLISSCAYFIRPEGSQLMFYGAGLFVLMFVGLVPSKMCKKQLVLGFLSMLFLFAVPLTHLTHSKDELPTKLHRLAGSEILGRNGLIETGQRALESVVETSEALSENFMYALIFPTVFGLFFHFSRVRQLQDPANVIILGLLVFNLMLMIFLYCFFGYMSRRYCLPLTVFLSLFLYSGFDFFVKWISEKRPQFRPWSRHILLVLIGVSISIGIPKLIRPIRIERLGYRQAIEWIQKSTSVDDRILVPDPRILFYAERTGFIEGELEDSENQADYIVSLVEVESENPEDGQYLSSFWLNPRKKDKRVMIRQNP